YQRRVEVVGDAEDFVVHEDFDVRAQLRVVGAPEGGVELGESGGEAAEERARGVAAANLFFEELAASAVAADVLGDPRRDLYIRAPRLGLRLAGQLLALHRLLRPVEIFFEPAEVE